jgi:hypothetical protein
MMWNYNSGYASHGLFGGLFGLGFLSMLAPLILWSIAWKGWSLWRAAKNDNKPWFVALLLINTMGILEILYIFVFGKEKSKSSKKK